MRETCSAAATLLVLIAAPALVACGGSGAASPSGSPTAAASATATSPSPGAPSLPAPSVAGTLAFTRFGELSADLCTIRTDGSELTALADDDVRDEGGPAWSPDGGKLAYVRGDTASGLEGTNFKLWLMEAGGSGQRRLFDDKTAGQSPAWSPDGKKLVFSRWITEADEIYEISTVDPDGSDLAKVIRGSNYLSATWSPDGRIYWVILEKQDVYSVRPDGSGMKRVTRLGDVSSCALTPDGKKLALYQMYPRNRIVVVPVEGGSTPTVLVEPLPDTISTAAISMSWSPDGTALAFANIALADSGTGPPPGQLPGSSLYIVNADGSGLSVVPGTGRAADPAWRPE